MVAVGRRRVAWSSNARNGRDSFPAHRPVLIDIHGGPEGQFRPSFLGRLNYLVSELGLVLIFPNVRGSSGYGKTCVPAPVPTGGGVG